MVFNLPSNNYEKILKTLRSLGTWWKTYYWITHTDTFRLDEPLQEIKASANSAIDEYEKVQRIKASTKEEIARVQEKAENLFKYVQRTTFSSVDVFVVAIQYGLSRWINHH